MYIEIHIVHSKYVYVHIWHFKKRSVLLSVHNCYAEAVSFQRLFGMVEWYTYHSVQA